ncbi:MAG: allophanate hydrolase [Jannaschia sp.]
MATTLSRSLLSDLAFTLPTLRAAYADGLSPVDVMEEVFRRIAAADDPAMFIHLADKMTCLASARALGPFDPDCPLWGMPFAVKDNIDVAGMPTTAACPAFSHDAAKDAFVVARLRDAGAIPVGKTNLDQFATGLVGVRSPYGVPRNALDPDIVPGGSSSGSAVVVSRGIVPFSLGTDTAGSGRVPAALNGIVGLKPTLGALSATGIVPACRSLDTISIFALTVEDAHAVLRVAAVFDATDAYARRVSVAPLGQALPALRIVAPDTGSLEFFGDDVQRQDFENTLADLSAQGARITRADFAPFYAIAKLLYDGAWVAERYAAIEHMMRDRPQDVHPVTRAIIAKAETLSAVDAFRGLYRLEDLRRTCAPVLATADMLCVPTIPTFYTCADLDADPVTPNSNLGTYTNFVNLLNLCALAIPTGPRDDGRPGSITLIAQAGQDDAIAAYGQKVMDARKPRLGATSRHHAASVRSDMQTPADADHIALAVCGAHMSGLPLNHELTSRGAQFLGAARTDARYAFFALAGGPPYRPGLVRTSDGSGSAIDVELWALPLAAVGGFMAGVPAPLAIGTIELEDGRQVKGFLCEAAGLEGAEDISRYGNWRHYLESADGA